MSVGGSFVHPLRVRYAECDPQGVVFNAHYLAYFDMSLTELWRAAFGGYQVMLDRGVDVMVAEASIRFRSAGRFDDVLELAIEIARLGNTSIQSRHRITRDGTLVVEGDTRHVVVDRDGLTKAPIPDWLRQGLAPWVVEGPSLEAPSVVEAPPVDDR